MEPSSTDQIAIKILGKEFLINCPHESQSELMTTTQLLDQRMKAIKARGKVFGLDRIAVMAALNLTHELLKAQQELDILKSQQQLLSAQIAETLSNRSE
ncbi:MAG: cell division protein ZapA [Motiliproteus sp.]|jgi:cell division protein ZapA